MAVCYRHPNRETGVSCSNCGRPICPDCMTSTSVGMRCPECSRETTTVKRIATTSERPAVTTAIIVVCVLVFIGMSSQGGGGFGSAGGRYYVDFALFGPAVAAGEWWRLLTSGFMHSGFLHIGFNMYILWWLGNMLEPSLGPVRFLALYLASMLAGSFGALLLSPDAFTVGASGAVFGLMGAALAMSRARGIDPMATGIAPLILLNLAITFIPGLNISIGGHLGGLAGGALAAFLMDRAVDLRRGAALPVAVCVLVGGLAVVGAFAVA
ncbi:MAG TPA: rhomboid family intramembrane serine protease [Solirubrobacteraceae bacterium]|nr:rhomboid family intramembrane serine protease [Solirubrobacteraceae bacterium]